MNLFPTSRRSAFLAALALAGWLAAAEGGSAVGEQMDRFSSGFAQPAGDAGESGGAIPFQRLRRAGDAHLVDYGFKDFGGDPFTLHARIPESAVWDSLGEFGLSTQALKAVDAWYARAQKTAVARANARQINQRLTAPTQAELDAKVAQAESFNEGVKRALDGELDGLAAEYKRRRGKVYADAGFKLRGEENFEVDVAKMVRRNARRLVSVSQVFLDQAHARGYAPADLVGAVAAMAQTAMEYRIPPDSIGDKQTGGILPPPQAFVQGWGDCDTKTALVMSVLSNGGQVRMVGLAIPNHYLMAIQQNPNRGDAYIDYQGEPYVLVEPTGPAWLPPGQVGEETLSFLRSGRDFEIEPI